MDEKSAVERVDAAYEKLTAANGRIKSLEKKLADGTLTMKEGAELTDLRAQAFGTAFSDKVLDIAQDERESACTELLRKRCDDTDEVAKAAQRGALSRQGLNLTPPTAPFEEDRARKIGHSLEDDTVPDETIQRRAKSATETMIRSQYDRNMKQGAKTCAEAGLKTYIIRDSASGCCKWCDEVAGKFAYGSEPKDVYRRHDNCSCTVTYESGRGRQNVWSKQYWSAEQEQKYLELRDELKAKKRTEAPNVKKPVRLSEKDVQAIINKVGGLTFGGNGGTIKQRNYSVAGLMFISHRDDLYKYAVKVPPIEGYEDVVFHADRQSFLILDPDTQEIEKRVSSKELADLIRNSNNYKNGDIRLLSCQSGYGDNSPAQQLADELGVRIKAPTEILAIDNTGETFISDSRVLLDMWENGENVQQTGEWADFEPRVK